MDTVDAVARAIAEEADDYYWDLLTQEEREPYYKRARAAIDAHTAALGLTEQWGWQLGDFAPKAYGSEREARERVAELDAMFAADSDSKRHSSLKRHIMSRLVSGWVRKDNTNE
ncbi:hypothetical protein [Mycobacterium gordonae]|uniref:Uncharacterized protein n=1 Tax=Mycobacterium gordonae TaxID=1778 RepID=A0A1X1WPE0_MYCGO|nr:hypothetical protein [Mycobacterium gordonae]MCV7004594.1 hypothetical protein [Mycobacterium gordonae]ODR14289.1 hypothetical protein BHQ23_33205 [Mycobacterium gordonae]ORV88516.1 hypothetical protein AWC08_22260 [Mycobacterium gordonae]